MLFEQSADGGHEFSLIFAPFVKLLCLTWSAWVDRTSGSSFSYGKDL
jgi:hypothetical protein